MASQNDSGWKTFPGTGTAGLSAWIIVDLNSDGSISAAGNGAKGIGVIQESTGFDSTTLQARVKMWNAPGTFMLTSSTSAITPGNTYSTITGGYAGPATGSSSGSNPAFFKAIGSAVTGGGIVVEFASLATL